MPPRFAYWTILIDDRPTAFRARDQADLLPTFHQLQRTNPHIAFKWFARGRLWASPEEARDAQRRPKPRPESRDRDWRPGGDHKDPRARFKRGRAKRHAGGGRPPRKSPRRG
jgi:hypothetical protein